MDSIINISNQMVLILAFLLICAPLISFFFSLIFKRFASLIAITAISISFIAAIILFIKVWFSKTLHFSIPWIAFNNFDIRLGFLFNDLTVLMLLLITLIALLVHIYSVEYIRKDKLKPRYFAYLSLFCFSMLSLVLADNLFLIYIFWELVGFSSYLLIGFWFTKEKAVLANKKAFIMNRLGDLGFLAGIMIMLSHFHTLDIDALFGSGNLIASSFTTNGMWVSPFNMMPDYWLTIAGLCFFAGAAAKSAQFPLHTWLPDAMEGPTAVSSLIHAATMVAAGVFLLVRIAPLFNETVLIIIASIGVFTAFMAATIALTQNDIKRVLAFSTISQLGFMMLAIGVGDEASAIFHLVTHAFFKCLLFLGAGIIIHELHHLKEKHQLQFDEQDMTFMGGLFKSMPITAIVFIIAAMALSGLPFTSGYLSKDAILISVFEWADVKGGIFWIFPIIVSLTSWLTTFYIFRVVFKVFFGDFRLPQLLEADHHQFKIHEANAWLKYPVMVLAVFCVAFVFSFQPFSLEASWLFHQLASQQHVGGIYHILVPVYINILSLGLLLITYLAYARNKFSFGLEQTWIFKFSYKQWYFNEIYDTAIVKPTLLKAKAYYWFDKNVIDGLVNSSATAIIHISSLANWLDVYIIDGLVNSVASVVERLNIWFRNVQNGKVQHYIVWMLLIMITFFIYLMIF
jgi:NADH-quinone oxidoreductase subunit L